MSDAAPDGIDLAVIRVPAKAKSILQRQLSAIGISRKHLFPDLEGLSAYVNWDTRRIVHYQPDKQIDQFDGSNESRDAYLDKRTVVAR